MPEAWHRVGCSASVGVIFTIIGLFIRKVNSGVQTLDLNSWSAIWLLPNLVQIPTPSLRLFPHLLNGEKSPLIFNIRRIAGNSHIRIFLAHSRSSIYGHIMSKVLMLGDADPWSVLYCFTTGACDRHC